MDSGCSVKGDFGWWESIIIHGFDMSNLAPLLPGTIFFPKGLITVNLRQFATSEVECVMGTSVTDIHVRSDKSPSVCTNYTSNEPERVVSWYDQQYLAFDFWTIYQTVDRLGTNLQVAVSNYENCGDAVVSVTYTLSYTIGHSGTKLDA